MFFVLKKASKVSRETNGAFDITVGPFVKLWRQSRRTQRLPTENELQEAHKSIGYKYIELNEKNRTVKFLKEDMELNAGGIGKGYAADQALEVLEEHQITSALVNAGGDLVAGAAPPGKKGWEIGIRVIGKDELPVNRTLSVSHASVATSGDIYQYVKIAGKKYSHIVNPRIGLGLTDQSRVTVIAPTGIMADSYASAISVMGPQESKELVSDKPHIEFYIIRRKDSKYHSWESKDFKKK